ncbi:hypothetical protein D3C87_77880 [compost metagenome]
MIDIHFYYNYKGGVDMSKVYHRGEDLFLYVIFKDEKNKVISNIMDPTVTIVYEKNGSEEILIADQPLNIMSNLNAEYYFNYTLPDDLHYSIYQIIYEGKYEEQIIRVVEEFHVIPSSESYDNAVKVYGFVHQSEYPLIGVTVVVNNDIDSKVIAKSYTREDGLWETYLYPGEYDFTFSKFGFNDQTFRIQLGTDYDEIQFDNVTLESEIDMKKGNGIFKISEKYMRKDGTPLNGLNVRVFNTFNIEQIYAECITNNSGEWELFLDSGIYLLKVEGDSLAENFDQVFRLKIDQNGKATFEDLSQNVALPIIIMDDIDEGDPNLPENIEVSDVVTDINGLPIIDVQLCVYSKNDCNRLIAQSYTDVSGRWTIYVKPGSYKFEFYHPEFNEFSEDRIV